MLKLSSWSLSSCVLHLKLFQRAGRQDSVPMPPQQAANPSYVAVPSVGNPPWVTSQAPWPSPVYIPPQNNPVPAPQQIIPLPVSNLVVNAKKRIVKSSSEWCSSKNKFQ